LISVNRRKEWGYPLVGESHLWLKQNIQKNQRGFEAGISKVCESNSKVRPDEVELSLSYPEFTLFKFYVSVRNIAE
jgi:hypothetical protein